MGVYRDIVVPKLCDCAMRSRLLAPYRARVIAEAEGRVLEIGAGSGLNLPLYPDRVSDVLALEPDRKLLAMARTKAAARPTRFLEALAEQIPLEDASVDTVVSTWTLCTIAHPEAALAEVRRVLKPRGRLLFVEHGLAPTEGVRRWQHRLNPLWRRLAGGCNLDRPIEALVGGAGFRIASLRTGYAPGPKVMTFLYEGGATAD
jgi:ubiquinone/menaquinone biosynthesis C-methylase UbiE